uniref:Brevican n=1 Tax=Poecilia formosa TaxID=48698 RepID=A0A087XPV5_POEFO
FRWKMLHKTSKKHSQILVDISTQLPSDDVRQLKLDIPHSGPIHVPLGSSISIPCFVSLSSSSSSSPSVIPRVKWTVVSGGIETQILVARSSRVKINEAYRDRVALLNYTSSPEDVSLWLGDLRHSDSGHYRCEVQQGLEDASKVVQVKVKGVVFHYRDALGRYSFSFQQAQRACEGIGAQVATPDQLLAAYFDGYEQCDAGWLADQSVRYPIQVPREGCYGDMDGQPGVRNYGTMDPDDLFDVYCYIEQIHGKVFYDPVPQQLSFDEAQSYCGAAGAQLATTAQLYSAWSEGLDRCSPGWLSDGSVRYPIVIPRERCGGPQAGVKTLYRFSNQTGFPEPSALHDVYCFKAPSRTTLQIMYRNKKERVNIFQNNITLNNPFSKLRFLAGHGETFTESPVDHLITEAENLQENVVILMEREQEIHLNQLEKQVEREAQSELESLPLLPESLTTEDPLDRNQTVTSDRAESFPTAAYASGFVKTLNESTEKRYDSQHLTEAAVSTISTTNTFDSTQSTMIPPGDYNGTDLHRNLSFTFHTSEFERSTYKPQTENQTASDTNSTESLQSTEQTIQYQEIHETSLDKSHTNYSETKNNRTDVDVEEAFWEGTTLAAGPLLQMDTTQASQDKGSPATQETPTTKLTSKAYSVWTPSDGSGDIFQAKLKTLQISLQKHKILPMVFVKYVKMLVLSYFRCTNKFKISCFLIDRYLSFSSLRHTDFFKQVSSKREFETEAATFTSSSQSSAAGFTAKPVGSAVASTTPQREAPDPTLSSVSRHEGSTSSDTEEVDATQAPEQKTFIVFPTPGKEENKSTSIEEEAKFSSTAVPKEEANASQSTEKIAPTFVLEVETKVTPTVILVEEAKEESTVTPNITFEEKAKFDSTLVLEEEASFTPSVNLTQPPTLHNLPKERAAVGGTGAFSDACLDDPCLNGGTCTERDGHIKCLCLPTYGGRFCQSDLERCEPGWDKFHGFCYRHFSQRQSWEVAERHCRTQGAHLVSIMTPEEQDYINSNYKEYQWTGLNDKTVEDDFRWSDGNPLLYENWYRGQPDSYFLSGEDCVVMVWHDNGRWSDVPCNYHLAYTCKKGTSSCGPPPKVRNASIFGKTRVRYETNAVVRYRCSEGFQQRLNPVVRCLSGGRWERPQILCIPEGGEIMQHLGMLSQTDSNFSAAETEFEATKETPQYWDIKF